MSPFCKSRGKGSVVEVHTTLVLVFSTDEPVIELGKCVCF